MQYIIVDKHGNPLVTAEGASTVTTYSIYKEASTECKKLPEGYSVGLLKETK